MNLYAFYIEMAIYGQRIMFSDLKKKKSKENAFIIPKLPDISLKTRKNETVRSTSSHKAPSYVYPKTCSAIKLLTHFSVELFFNQIS